MTIYTFSYLTRDVAITFFFFATESVSLYFEFVPKCQADVSVASNRKGSIRMLPRLQLTLAQHGNVNTHTHNRQEEMS